MASSGTYHQTIMTPSSSGSTVGSAPVVVAPEVMLQQPIRVQSLELFDGSKGKVEVFIMQLRLCFEFQPLQFAVETSKILYAASYLRGTAAKWFSGYLEDYLNNMITLTS